MLLEGRCRVEIDGAGWTPGPRRSVFAAYPALAGHVLALRRR